MRLRECVQVFNRCAKSPVEERVAFASREGTSYGRSKAKACFALRLLVWHRSKERCKSGLAFPQHHGVDLRMLFKDVLGMEGGMLAAPYTVDVR
jgi:hypothetical protein